MRQSIAFISQTAETPVESVLLVVAKESCRTRKGSPFLRLIVADSSGQMEAKIWANAEHAESEFGVGSAIELEGVTRIYRSRTYIDVRRVRRRCLDALSAAERPKLDPEMLGSVETNGRDGNWVCTTESGAAKSEAARIATERRTKEIVARLSGETIHAQCLGAENTVAHSRSQGDSRIAAIVKKYSGADAGKS